MEYMPFGELLVDEHLNSYNSPFKFNGKELDDETGNYYYGARYYNPKTSIWLSVDPLADDYPGWSPYNYCLQNPVILTDPTGAKVEGDVIESPLTDFLNTITGASTHVDDGKDQVVLVNNHEDWDAVLQYKYSKEIKLDEQLQY